VGWMDDETGAAAEDRMKLIFAVDRKTGVATGFKARETVTEMPAPGALANIPRKRSSVANLRRGDAAGRFGKHCIVAQDQRMAAQRIERNLATDVHRRRGQRHLVQA